jgi:phenylacetate-CoA ligase
VRTETHRWAGYQPGQRLIKLWGSSSENAQYKRLKAKVGLWIRNEIFLDTFELSEEKICDYAGIINRFKPRLIVGYASSLYSISQYVLNHSIEIKDIGAIVSSAGTLYPEMRQAMENAFHCKVFNRYGSREVTIVAAEDGSDKGLRVTPIAHVEVIRADGSPCEEGEIGEIVVTSLSNFAMPLIRYRIGDMGVLKKHGVQTYLEKIVGRTVELFKTKDGRLVDGEYFTHLTYFKDWIKNFRFRQIDYDYIVIEIVLCSTHKPPENELSEVEAGVKKMMGDDVRINWKFVDNIEPLPSGKYVYTISDIK